MKIRTKVQDYESEFRELIAEIENSHLSLLLYAANKTDELSILAAKMDSNDAANLIHELVKRFGPHVLIGALPVGVVALGKAEKDRPLYIPKSTEVIQ